MIDSSLKANNEVLMSRIINALSNFPTKAELKTELSNFVTKTEFNDLKVDVNQLKDDVAELRGDFHTFRIFVENDHGRHEQDICTIKTVLNLNP